MPLSPATGIHSEVVDLSFEEEPLGMPAITGFGFPRFEFGEFLGPDRRYKIVRKLGRGLNSTTWLVHDEQSRNYFALKGLTGNNTVGTEKGLLWERDALLRVSFTPNQNCLTLKDSFTVVGKGSAGSHLCFVTPLLAGDVKYVWRSVWKDRLPLPLTKRILLHTLRGLAHAHKCGVVHTDLKPENIFVSNVMSTSDIDTLLVVDPSRTHGAQDSSDGIVFPCVSQPFPGPSLEDSMNRTYILGDFGSAQPIGKPLSDEITPNALRPPEIILGAPWDEKVDIWTFGCLIYELVGGRLWRPEPCTVNDVELDATETLLHQIMCHTIDDFEAELLQVSRNAATWFDLGCNLKKGPKLYNIRYEDRIKRLNILSEAEVESWARVLRRCLRINPAQRCSAEELLSDPWFKQD
ncbi:kinase-like protein [Mycena metata]|uniref:Kinase-like protein n=1 Tax=Mycena metata TaxID=1033252 RepID=A0AAD7NKJ5_9AGAR|nr:kinase-like protein [Mycena metata]